MVVNKKSFLIFLTFLYLLSSELITEAKSYSYFLNGNPEHSYSPDNIPTGKWLNNIHSDADTNKTKEDSIKWAKLANDSTARLSQFKYKPKSTTYIDLYDRKKNGFFAYPSPALLTRTTTIDSTGEYVIIKEKLGNMELKPYVKIKLSEYIELRKMATNRKVFESLGYKYELKEKKDDLGNLFQDLTNIVIPLPSSDVFSIFGPPTISLRINGSINISGGVKSETTEGVTTALRGNTQTTPDFKQTVMVNVEGKIGDKLSINADWNTERQFEYENSLKLNYKGYEDEIIQSIEAGNVSLQAPGLIGSSEALFGIKALFKFGAFSLTALASQKKSEVQEMAITGGASAKNMEIRLHQYSENHFFIDNVYSLTDDKHNFFYLLYGKSTYQPNDSARYYKVKEIEVYKSITGTKQPDEIKANSFIDLPNRVESSLSDINYYRTQRNTKEPVTGESEIGYRFTKLIYGFDYIFQPETGYISFNTQIQNEDVVAVAYRIEGPTSSDNDDLYFGEFERDVLGKIENDTARVLKLVKPRNLQPKFKKAWALQLKNIYPLGGNKINDKGFKFNIMYEPKSGDPVDNIGNQKLVSAFGLDLTDESKSGPPDGIFDFNSRTINTEKGEVIFPVLQPFSSSNITKVFNDQNIANEIAYQSVYDTTKAGAQSDNIHDKLKLTCEFSAASSSSFQIGFNVVENSVKVLLNNIELINGQDYSVDYMMGVVSIKKPEALSAGSNLSIKFENNDMVSLASKSLFGFRGLYDLNKDTKFGFTFMNLSQKTLSDKIRIGEEPISNSIWGADFQSLINLPFITKGLNSIFNTTEKSSLRINGEFAYMDPDPNTKKSKIAGDAGKNIAYIDDFEGSKKLVPLTIAGGGWKDISVPFEGFSIAEQKSVLKYKSKGFWFTRPDVSIKEIWGNRKQVSSKDQQLSVLNFVNFSKERGQFNPDSVLTPGQNWAGMMTRLSAASNNLAEENIEFVEFWINVLRGDKNDKLIIDLGQISEDILPNGSLDTEDKNGNLLLDNGEDTGFDGIGDNDEKILYPKIKIDPAGDNFTKQKDFYSKNLSAIYNSYKNFNGTEGNGESLEGGRTPDSEDMNSNNTLDVINSYFRYEIPLDMNNNPYISGVGENGWYQIRIPLRKPEKEIQKPSLNIVEMMRIWVNNVNSDSLHVRFAELNLVGNQWQKVKNKIISENDTTLTVETISVEENPEYELPPGLERERDKTNPNEEILKNEQSLNLKIRALEDGEKREIVKYNYKPLDVFNYKEMKLFVHGDKFDVPGSVSHYTDASNYSAEVYFRFGSDTNNFYEYRQPVRRDWNEIRIVFEKLTSIKNNRKRVDSLATQLIEGTEGHRIGIKGLPSLTNIKFFTFGVLNPGDKGRVLEAVSGDIWVNELRVLDADDKEGMAYNFSTNLKLADLINLNFSYNTKDPYFHRLNERFGSRNDNRSWTIDAEVDIMKMLPVNLPGSRLAVKYTHVETSNNPLYIPSTDIKIVNAVEEEYTRLKNTGLSADSARKIAEEIKFSNESMSVSDTWNVSGVQIKVPSKAWYIEQTINNLILNFNFTRDYKRDPATILAHNWSWNGGLTYRINFSPENYFKFADIPLLGEIFKLFDEYKDAKFNFTPQTFDSDIKISRLRNYNLTRNISLSTVKEPTIRRDFNATRGFGFDWAITDMGFLNPKIKYDVAVASTYAHLLTQEISQNKYIERTEDEIWQNIINGSLFGIATSYAQSFGITFNPRLPSFTGLEKYLTLNFSYDSRFDWANNLQQGDLGRGAKYTSKITAGVKFDLKGFGDLIFGNDAIATPGDTKKQPRARGNRVVNKEGEVPKTDSTKLAVDDSELEESTPFYQTGLKVFRDFIKYTLFDYKNINLNFNQNNSNTYSGVKSSGTGFKNFWGFTQSYENGPDRKFMLGISNYAGPRAANGIFNDLYSQNNDFDISTSKELWTDARIDVNWKIGWGIQKSYTIETDENGIERSVKIQNYNANIDRTFWSFPFIGGDRISKIREQYTRGSKDSLAKSFLTNMEDFRIFGVILPAEISKFVPRPNWKFQWNGLEKISFLKDVFTRFGINHAYSSTYREAYRFTPDGKKELLTQGVQSQFSPLIGVNFTLKALLDGLSGSLSYNIKTSYDVGFSTENITQTESNDINFSASYTKNGFEIPLFGFSLKNDITLSINFSYGKNSKINYLLAKKDNPEGIPLDGTTRTVIEPKLKYVMSSKVTGSLFYRRTDINPAGASRVPKTITNEFGLEVNIQIN